MKLSMVKGYGVFLEITESLAAMPLAKVVDHGQQE